MKNIWVVYYGVLQFLHIIFLVVFLINSQWVFEFINNPIDWSFQFINMLKAISVIDLANAIVSIYFVFSFLKKRKNSKKIGIIVLTLSVYSAQIFGLGIFWNQLHIGNEFILSAFSLPFLPVFYIWYKMAFKEL